MMHGQGTILLFIKEPHQGRVKSRIAAVLGEQTARALYQCFVLDELDTIDRTDLRRTIFVHPPEAVPSVSAWLAGRGRFLPQIGADLGARMEQAFRAIFAEGAPRAVLIGSDLPDLPASLLEEAMTALDRSDAVIGPAQDGGYYLIGFRSERFLAEPFRGITWSAADVLERTREILEAAGRSSHVLPLWRDMDTVEDLRSLLQRKQNSAFSASRTMRLLVSLQGTLFGTEEPHAHL